MNSPKQNNLTDLTTILYEMVVLGIDFLRMLRQEINMDDPMMKMNQGNTRSATVNPKNKQKTIT